MVRSESHNERQHPTVEGRRVCAEPGCRTILSRYNLEDRCYPHRYPKFDIRSRRSEP